MININLSLIKIKITAINLFFIKICQSIWKIKHKLQNIIYQDMLNYIIGLFLMHLTNLQIIKDHSVYQVDHFLGNRKINFKEFLKEEIIQNLSILLNKEYLYGVNLIVVHSLINKIQYLDIFNYQNNKSKQFVNINFQD